MSVFASIYQDEDVSALLAQLLRSRGFDVTSARDEDSIGETDPQQLARAIAQGRAILTHNRLDFEALHGEYLVTGRHHYGIIIAKRRDVYELARRLAILLNTLTGDEFENQLFYV
jgi:hypothetical protein